MGGAMSSFSDGLWSASCTGCEVRGRRASVPSADMTGPAPEEALPAVAARSVGKSFRIPEQRVHTLKERALAPAAPDPPTRASMRSPTCRSRVAPAGSSSASSGATATARARC